MSTLESTNLVRKQVMLSTENIAKLERIAKAGHLSIANVVRSAVDSYSPDAVEDSGDDSELMALVSARLKEAIEDTASTRKRLNKTLTTLEAKN